MCYNLIKKRGAMKHLSTVESLMFRTGLTKGIFEGFLQTHHFKRSELDVTPFIFVDPSTGQIKLLTKLMNFRERGNEIFAISILKGGDVEVLSTEN